jgi:hypothetical protein
MYCTVPTYRQMRIRWSCALYSPTILTALISQRHPYMTFNNTHQLEKLHSHFHFIKTQSLDVFRTSLAHPEEALHEHNFGGCSAMEIIIKRT